MTYRKIVVSGEEVLYSVGRSGVKIRGIGTFVTRLGGDRPITPETVRTLYLSHRRGEVPSGYAFHPDSKPGRS